MATNHKLKPDPPKGGFFIIPWSNISRMTDFEMRQALLAIGQTVQLQSFYLSSLHRSVVRMYEAVKKELPMFEPAYDSANPEIQDYPGSAELLQKVAALLEQLKKPS